MVVVTLSPSFWTPRMFGFPAKGHTLRVLGHSGNPETNTIECYVKVSCDNNFRVHMVFFLIPSALLRAESVIVCCAGRFSPGSTAGKLQITLNRRHPSTPGGSSPNSFVLVADLTISFDLAHCTIELVVVRVMWPRVIKLQIHRIRGRRNRDPNRVPGSKEGQRRAACACVHSVCGSVSVCVGGVSSRERAIKAPGGVVVVCCAGRFSPTSVKNWLDGRQTGSSSGSHYPTSGGSVGVGDGGL